MPEGPEVRKYADAVGSVLTRNIITASEARTREARAWLRDNERDIVGKRVGRVRSHGKHLIGYIDGGFYFHAHLMMWGRWLTFDLSASTNQLPIEKDRRERARIVTNKGAAILLSAPIFNAGAGDPYEQIENLQSLGPDALPYNRRFNRSEFEARLLAPEHHDVAIGAALLNQRIVAGLGNYLRAEILFACKMNPWRLIGELSEQDLKCLSRNIPLLTRRSYERAATALDRDRSRMASDRALVYQPGREFGTRHLVFRRTNLPCLRCGKRIRQLRQKTYRSEQAEDSEERTRIVYFCPKCQNVDVDEVRQKPS